MKPLLLAGLAAGAAIPALGLSLRYRRDMNAALVRLSAVDRHVIGVPSLIAHTKDDQPASHEASPRAAQRIPGARSVSLESGGILMLGQQMKNGGELADFFADRRERRAERVAS